MKNYYKAGDIILVPFPFTDLSYKKVRPAFVLRDQEDSDILVAPITTAVAGSRTDYRIRQKDYKWQPLPVISCIKYKKIFTLHESLVLKMVSSLTSTALSDVKKKVMVFIAG